MQPRANRRQFERFPHTDVVFGYVDGAHFSGSAVDLSQGGVLIETASPVPLGSIVAIVFREQSSVKGEPIFLMGRVVRRPRVPRPGVALRWEKAVYHGQPGPLREFLIRTLKISGAECVMLSTPEGKTKSIFHFTCLDPKPDEFVPVRPSVKKRLPSVKVEGDAWSSGVGSSAILRADRRTGAAAAPGPLTTRISTRASHAQADFPAELDIGGKRCTGKVLSLGKNGMVVEAPFSPARTHAEVRVEFHVLTRGGRSPIVCSCRVERSTPARNGTGMALDLTIESVDEGGEPGLLLRYVRWLHFNALATE